MSRSRTRSTGCWRSPPSWPARPISCTATSPRSAAMELHARGGRPWLGAHRPLLPGEGVVLRARPLSPALRRQRGRGRRELHGHPCRASGAWAAHRAFRHCGRRRRSPTCACARRPSSSRRPCWCSAAPSWLGEAAPALIQRFYVKPSELQAESPYIQRNIELTREAYDLGAITVKPFPAEQDLTFRVAGEGQRDRRQHPALGLAAPARRLRSAAGDPHLLPVPRRRRRPLPSRQHLSAGDDFGARAHPVAPAGQRANLGQPASPVHPRRRGGHVSGDAEVGRRSTDLLFARTSRRSPLAVRRSPSHASISAKAPPAT